jgi:ABC-type proline/glycine betaine transport system, permease component
VLGWSPRSGNSYDPSVLESARSDTGRGLAAGIGIVLLAIIIDRITLAWTKKQREALGLIS